MKIEILIAYCTAIFIASIIPGPSMLLAMTQGIKYGWIAGAISGIGNVLATLTQATLSYLILLQTGKVSDTLLIAIKIAGAAYIIYLGWTLLKIESFGVAENSEMNGENAKPQKKATFHHLKDGYIFAIANPKAIIFFAALFPQFVRAGNTEVTHILVIFTPIIIIAYLCFMAYTLAGIGLMKMIGHSKQIGKIFGAIIMLAGATLLLT